MPEAINAPTLLVVPAAAGTPAVASAAPAAGGLFGGFLAAALSVGGALAQGAAQDATSDPAADASSPSPLLAGVSAALLADTPDEDETAAEPASTATDGAPGLPLPSAATTPLAIMGAGTGGDATDAAALAPSGAIDGTGQGTADAGPDVSTGTAGPGPATIADALAAVTATPQTAASAVTDDTLPASAASVPAAVAEAAATSAETALARLAALIAAAAPASDDPVAPAGEPPASPRPAPSVATDSRTLAATLAAGRDPATDRPALATGTVPVQAESGAQDTASPPAADGVGDAAAPDRPVAAGRVTEVTVQPARAPSEAQAATNPAAEGADADPSAAAATTVTALAAASRDRGGDPLVDALIDMVATAKVTPQRGVPAEVVLRDAAIREAAERAPGTRPLVDDVEVARRADAPARPVEDAASAVARSTVTRDTAGTALAAAIIGADPAMRPAASRSTKPAERPDRIAATPTAPAGTAATGGATVPPPSPGGLAAAATAFAARIKALGGERTDSPVAGTAAGPGTGATGTPAGALSTASALPGAQAPSQVGGQAGTSAGATQAGLTGVLPQIAAEITRRAAAGETRFQIRLDPVELGRIDVRLSLDDAGEARAQLTVERRETYELIARDQRGLERTLREAGYEVRDGSVQVTLRQNAEGGGSGGGAFERFAQQQQQHGQHQHSGGQRGGDPSAGPVPNTPDATEADMLARLAAFASRPAGIAGRVDIRL